MLAPYRDRLEIVELVTGMSVVSDVDVILYDTFARGQAADADLEKLCRDAKVVVFTWSRDELSVNHAAAAGAVGVLWKGLGAEDIVDAIEKISDGHTWRTAQPGGLRQQLDGGWPGRDQGLSAREAEVLALVTQGLSNQEIADRLYLSINSIKTYIKTSYRKLNVSRRSQAVAWCLLNGFEPVEQRVFVLQESPSDRPGNANHDRA